MKQMKVTEENVYYHLLPICFLILTIAISNQEPTSFRWIKNLRINNPFINTGGTMSEDVQKTHKIPE